ncbi:MAG: ATP-binding cassette domain-containing protein [Gammaproteobacteria bacterium]|nr:ATP-binding cassette domain-containing protein [Gammaproteobacteria bacterium]
MALLRLSQAQLAFGPQKLLDQAEFSLDHGESVALVGRNGAGKTTLLKVVSGLQELDDGQNIRQDNLKVATLYQDIPSSAYSDVYQSALALAGRLGQLHLDYNSAVAAQDNTRLATIGDAIDTAEAWDLPAKIEEGLGQLDIAKDSAFNALSGGKKRMLALVAAIAQKPDIILLDEPTNHLDLQAIEKLRQLVTRSDAAVLFITHDRAFMRGLATRIVELDRGRLYSYDGGYDRFLRSRDERLHAEALANEQFDKKLAEEEVWIRKGIQARRTRNEGRVRALKDMRKARAERVELQRNPNFSLGQVERSGKLVVSVKDLRFHFADRTIINHFDTTILRGDKVGIIGPNGVGKTTLVKLLLGELPPQAGTIKLGTQLDIAYFDQLRGQLNDALSVGDNVSGGSDHVTINGESKHIISYLGEFLFTPERVRSPIHRLSGGERNRLLLAKLFAQPANLLVLDEPTNDLDLETLELLESLLSQYEGTMLLISHDREFVDNVVTSVIALEGNGQVEEYVGGYSDWLQRQKSAPAASARPASNSQPKPAEKPAAPKKKLSYKLQRELEQIPAQIEVLEQEQSAIETQLADPELFVNDPTKGTALSERLGEIELELLSLLERWETLEQG